MSGHIKKCLNPENRILETRSAMRLLLIIDETGSIIRKKELQIDCFLAKQE